MTIAKFKEQFAAGPFAWPGGYEIFAITSDGDVLCWDCIKSNLEQIEESIKDKDNSGWRVDAFDAECNTDSEVTCDNCNRTICEAYAE